MTRRCTCDIPFCDGIECYLADPKPIEEVSAPRPKFLPSAEYLAWVARIDAEQFTEVRGDPMLRRRA